MVKDGRAVKRKREDDDEVANLGPATQQLERGVPFFDDGNVILIAEGTCYKVYQGILSQDSYFFREMFSLPQPPNVEWVDGCPVVHLEESPKDLARILSVWYDNKNTYFTRENTLPFVVVSAMLRLGYKYQIEHIRDEAIRRLQACFPSNLKDFRTRDTMVAGDDDPHFLCRDLQISLTAQHSIAVINLARDYDMPCLLGPAFFTCTQLDYEFWVEGFVDEDGNHWKLSPKDLQSCMHGERSLREANIRALAWMLPPQPSPKCHDAEKCKAGLTTSATRLRETMLGDSNVLFHPCWITSLASGKLEDKNAPRGFCSTCAKHFRSIYDCERQKAWQDLGKYFGYEEPSDE